MKKMVKAALAAVLVCFSSSLFAAEPESFLKDTTFGLFEDEVVDNFAWGLDDTTGLVLGGFRSSDYNFNIGAGAWLGPLWWSIYDTGSFAATITNNKSVKNDAYAEDGINTDYVDVTTDTWKNRNPANNLKNDLFVSFSTGDWGIQSYWKLDDTTPAGNYGKSTEYDEDKATGYARSKESNIGKYKAKNTFGANFSGIGASELGDVDFYVQLDNFEVEWGKTANNESYTESYKQNGVTYTGGQHYPDQTNNPTWYYDYNTIDHKVKDTNNTFKPSVSAQMGFSLPDLGSMTSKFILGEKFTGTLDFNKNVTTNTYVEEDFNSKTTTKTSSSSNEKMKFSWENTLSPIFVFDFDVGERLSIKASAGADVTLKGKTNNRPYTGTWIEEKTVYDKINKTTTKQYQKNVDQWNGGQLEKEFETSVKPNTALALVYQVKPEKFNLNMGLELNVGTFTWTTTTKTNEAVKTTQYGEYTDDAGTKWVYQDDVTITNRGDGAGHNDVTAETKETKFVSKAAVAPNLKIGATWFITENASLDIAYTGTGFNNISLWNGLMGSNLKLMFTVKF